MSTTVAVTSIPTYIELIRERLAVRVYRHALDTRFGQVPCWSYVTDGLRQVGQKELVFTLRRPADADPAHFPTDPFDIFRSVFHLARKGRILVSGDHSRFSPPAGFLGVDGAIGLAHFPAVTFRGVNYPDRALASVLLTPEEVEVVGKLHGSYRVLTLLGLSSGYFPFPPWSEAGRKPVIKASDLGQSLLGQVPLLRMPGMMVRRQGHRINLRIRHDAGGDIEKYLDRLPEEGPLALITEPDPQANARLVWRPGLPVEVLTPDGGFASILTGGFVAFVIAEGLEGGHICEDGFAIRVRPATWTTIREALRTGRPYTLAATDQGMHLVVGRDEIGETVRLVSWRYSQPDSAAATRVEGKELAAYSQRVTAAVEEFFCNQPPDAGQILSIGCVLRDGGGKFWLDCDPDPLLPSQAEALHKALRAIRPPAVRGNCVAWVLRFDLWGGYEGTADGLPDIPAAWAKVCPPSPEGFLPDAALERIWNMG